MKPSRTIIMGVAALAILATVAIAPAGAKGKPAPEPTSTYTVTFQLGAGAEGLGTCGGNTLTMSSVDGALQADGRGGTSVPIMYLRADVPWSRTYPEPSSGETFDECHGGAIGDSSSDVPSYFLVHSDRNGAVANLLWAFDVYTQEGTTGKNRTPAIKEYFRLWSSDIVTFADANGDACPIAPETPVTCYVSGPFEVWHYYPIEQIGTAELAFSMTITPN